MQHTDLMSSMEKCTGHVEAMDMARYDGAEEKDAIEYGVPTASADYHDCKGRKEEVDEHHRDAVREPFEHVDGFVCFYCQALEFGQNRYRRYDEH